ncbi:transporter substrate-binding domain-containing protein [Modicisalibacter tunisiensis]|uniref:transporter substrate-binding domain-containing protein n=1 Tax=Modicisalibacter tunisiensis TaxID=390637 RepID=UPI001CCFF53F|nr:transporter substrate-binding domain-containing protein [Modicisalibacter tunisiensis]MBZ9537523.1 transporter substrate-binding domain-containing protein [Modicisalibacter tunisiensis]
MTFPGLETRQLATGLILALGLAGAASSQAADTYTVGVEASFPPWAYVEGGDYKGIAIDAMEKIAEDQGLDIEFKDLPFPSLIPALSAEKIDILATGLTVTEQRAKVIDFTVPWWETNDVIVVPKDSDLNVFTAVCCGATIGVQGGSSQKAWMEANVTNSDIDVNLKSYDSYVTAITDMLNGRISAVDVDDTSAQEYINEGRPVKLAGKIFIRAPLALAVSKGDPQGLLAKLNQGIVNLAESGEWATIVHNYIPGVTVPSVPGNMPEYVDTYRKPVAGLPDLGN